MQIRQLLIRLIYMLIWPHESTRQEPTYVTVFVYTGLESQIFLWLHGYNSVEASLKSVVLFQIPVRIAIKSGPALLFCCFCWDLLVRNCLSCPWHAPWAQPIIYLSEGNANVENEIFYVHLILLFSSHVEYTEENEEDELTSLRQQSLGFTNK